MSVSCKFSGYILVVTLVGNCGHEMITAIDGALADNALEPGTSLLIDLRLCTETPSSEDFRERARYIGARRAKGLSRYCAVVIGPKPIDFGFARMACTYFAFEGLHMEIFTRVNEAVGWLESTAGTEPATE